jgi:hypothetical protein
MMDISGSVRVADSDICAITEVRHRQRAGSRSIHERSSRKMRVHCYQRGNSRDLLESELFGHEGALPGSGDKTGSSCWPMAGPLS